MPLWNRRILGLAVVTMTLAYPMIERAQSVTKPRGPDRCSEKLKLNRAEDFERLAVRSKLDKIIQELQFSPKDFDLLSFKETEDLGAHAYNLGFLVSSKGEKAAKDAKASVFKGLLEHIKTREADIGKFSPQAQITLQSWISNATSMVSKAFDQGHEDGAKPCPELPAR